MGKTALGLTDYWTNRLTDYRANGHLLPNIINECGMANGLSG